VKPGLSSFASDPEAGADTITALLSLAQERIPQDKWGTAPVTLKATAGLRLLPAEQAEALLKAVKERMVKAGFDNRGVGIMEELDEGVFGWMTVNYLLGRIYSPSNSYVALDLGGGSTQITFLPSSDDTIASSPSDFLHPVKVFTSTHTIYSHSYLGLGLMAAREAIFRHNARPNSTSLVSPCMVTDYPTSWQFHGKVYTISPWVAGNKECMQEVKAVIDTMGLHQCKEISNRKIAAFSYFYDRAVDAGLISKGKGGTVTVHHFLDAAQRACSKQANSSESFLCVDLSFIAGLLHHGYSLDPEVELELYKKIDGHETSWALGAAFQMLE